MEWEVLGLNLRRHPLSSYREALIYLGVTPSEEIRNLPYGTHTRVASLIECPQCPPTKSGVPVYFLLIENAGGLLHATIFKRVYERYGHILHRSEAFLLEDLTGILSEAERAVASPSTTSGSGAFLRAARGRRRAG